MIVASEERYVPVSPGFLVLQDTEGLYYYVHRTFYEQAVVLEDRYKDDIEVLQNTIGGNPDYVAVQKFTEYAPRPINIMGYFLALLQEDIEDYEDIIGAMDVITKVINPRSLIKQPLSIRQSVSFSVSIREEYQDAWELFFRDCYTYDDLKATMEGGGGRVAQKPARSYSSAPVSNYEPEDEEDDVDGDVDDSFINPDGSINQEKYNAYMEKIMADVDAEMEKEAAANAPAAADTPKVDKPASSNTPAQSDGGDGLSVIASARRRRAL